MVKPRIDCKTIKNQSIKNFTTLIEDMRGKSNNQK